MAVFGNGLYGCQAAPTDTAAAADDAAAETAAPKTLSAEDQQRVSVLLQQADAALAADHLTYPAKGRFPQIPLRGRVANLEI